MVVLIFHEIIQIKKTFIGIKRNIIEKKRENLIRKHNLCTLIWSSQHSPAPYKAKTDRITKMLDNFKIMVGNFITPPV